MFSTLTSFRKWSWLNFLQLFFSGYFNRMKMSFTIRTPLRTFPLLIKTKLSASVKTMKRKSKSTILQVSVLSVCLIARPNVCDVNLVLVHADRNLDGFSLNWAPNKPKLTDGIAFDGCVCMTEFDDVFFQCNNNHERTSLFLSGNCVKCGVAFTSLLKRRVGIHSN